MLAQTNCLSLLTMLRVHVIYVFQLFVMGMYTHASVIPFFLNKAKLEIYQLLTLKTPVLTSSKDYTMVFWALQNVLGSEILCQNSSYRILDIANAIGPSCTKSIVGIGLVKTMKK